MPKDAVERNVAIKNRTKCYFFLYLYVILKPNCIFHHEYFMQIFNNNY